MWVFCLLAFVLGVNVGFVMTLFFCRHQGQQEISARAAVTGNDGNKQEIILERNDLE